MHLAASLALLSTALSRRSHTLALCLQPAQSSTFFVCTLIRSLAGTGSAAGQELKLKHQDFEYQLEGDIVAIFLWRPFPQNVTEQYRQW